MVNLYIDHVSVSMMRLWEQCRECWKYKYIMKLEGETPDYFIDGRKYHEEVHYYHTGQDYNKKLIESYTKTFKPEYRMESEVGFYHKFKGVNLPVTGIIDNLGDGFLSDLKFMKGSFSQKQADENDQATIYLMYLKEVLGMIVPFYFQCVNKVNGSVKLIKTTRTEKDFEAMKKKINNFDKEVAEGDFTALPNQRCFGRCEYYSICSNCNGRLR